MHSAILLVVPCRTQHSMCWDSDEDYQHYIGNRVSMPHAAFYVWGLCRPQPLSHQG